MTVLELSRDDAVRLLRRHSLARVAVCTPLGPWITPVAITVHDGDVVFGTAPYSRLGTYGRDVDVAVEVDEPQSADGTGAVVVVGRASVVEDPDEVAGLRAMGGLDALVTGRRALYIRVHVREVGQAVLGAPGHWLTRHWSGHPGYVTS